MEETSPTQLPVHKAIGLSSTGVFLVTLAIQLLGYIPTHFFAQGVGLSISGRAALGTFQWFLLLASSINMIGDLRIGSAYTFYVARGESPRAGTGTYFVLRVAMVAAGGAILWATAPALPYSTVQYLGLFALWMALPVLWSVSTVYMQLWVAQGHSVKGQVPTLVESIVRTTALTYFAVQSLTLAPAQFDNIIPEVTFAYVLGAASSAVYSFPSVWRQTERFRAPVARRFFKFAWPLMGSLLLLYLSSTLIQFIVVVQLPPAVYNVFLSANGLRILALSIPAAVAVPLFPHLSGLHKRQDYELIRQRTWAALRYTALVVLPLVMAMVVYRVNILNILYSGGYAGGATPLAILALSAVPAALTQIIGTALNSVGQQRLELYLTSLQVAVLIGASLLLLDPVRFLGLDGLTAAALAVLLSSVGALVVNVYFMETRLGVRIQLRPILTILGASIGGFFAVAEFNDLLPVNRYYQLIAGVVLGSLVYAVILSLVGELSKADIRQIGGSVGLPQRASDLIARLCWRDETWPVNPLPEGGAPGLRPLEGDRADLEPEHRTPPPKR
ncbi:MAG TPA: oligosaccharide flippase family protein [Thermoplasmata archaeon]|nr:oligosaccharide flippase family protein [Thermoplasmata archaeon]